MKKVLFIKNTLVFTVTALLLRFIGIIFRVWISGKIGSEGMGLYQLIISVYMLCSTFATSGISTAVTRIVTNSLAEKDVKGAKKSLKAAILISLAIAFVTAIMVFAFAKTIAVFLLSDERTTVGIRVLTLGLPFMAVCSVLRGYFLARRKALPSSIGQIIEQLARILIIFFLVERLSSYGLAYTTAAVVFGDAVSEGVGTLYVYIMYRLDIKRLKGKPKTLQKYKGIFGELYRIAMPISSGRYLHTGLRTCESILTPRCLSGFLGAKGSALEQFGMLKGMALPILLFPASLLSAISSLLVPEMSEALKLSNKKLINSAIEKIFYITAVISFPIAAIFFVCSYEIGTLLYNDEGVGYLIRALAPLVPFMYIDLIADGILKGLDEQNFLFKTNVSDSFLRIIFILIFVSKYGMTGFLGVMLFSNLFTSLLSVKRIIKVTSLKLNYYKILVTPMVVSFAASALADFACKTLKHNSLLFFCAAFFVLMFFYLLFMVIFGGLLNNLNLKKPLKSRKNKRTV